MCPIRQPPPPPRRIHTRRGYATADVTGTCGVGCVPPSPPERTGNETATIGKGGDENTFPVRRDGGRHRVKPIKDTPSPSCKGRHHTCVIPPSAGRFPLEELPEEGKDGVRIRWQTSKIAVLEKGIPSPDPDAGTGTTARCNPGTGPARAGTRSTPGRTPTRSLLHMPKTTALQLQGAPPGFSSRCWTFRCLDCDSVRHSCPCPYFKKRAEISPGRRSYSSERPEAPRRFVRCRHSPPAHPVGAGCRAV